LELGLKQTELPDEVLKGIQLFNQGQFFSAHEALERAWRAETAPVRFLYQGILQVGVGCYHIQRRNFTGADHLLTRGLKLLDPFAPNTHGIDLNALITDAIQLKQFVERCLIMPSEHYEPPAFPQIRFLEE
jgi:predicted metal-dependent hydrolase